jgi:hypothetical protein
MTVDLSPRRPRRWMAFFGILAVLASVAIVVPLVYNLSIQLRPEQLAEARQRWQAEAPLNYDLEYLVRTTRADHGEERAYLVQVREGRVVLVVSNSDLFYLDPSLAGAAGLGVLALSSPNPNQYGVPALFDVIETTLHKDESTGQHNFATAQFDPNDGHPFHYVHRIRGTKERVEWTIKMTRFSPTNTSR